MKKLLMMLGLAMTSLTISAQESTEESGSELPDGVLALEWRFNPFDYESKPVKLAEMTARLFLNEKSALRLGVGVGYNSDKDENTEYLNTQGASSSSYNITDKKTTIKNNATTLKVSLGYEYHFANTGRLDFYGGIEGGYLGRFYSATEEINSDITDVSTSAGSTSTTVRYNYVATEYNKRNADGDKHNENGFFGTIFTGIDFYVYKKLYIGAELGVTFNMGKEKNGYYETVTRNGQKLNGNTVNESVTRYNSETGITTASGVDPVYGTVKGHTGNYTKVYFEPAIRIGWMF